MNGEKINGERYSDVTVAAVAHIATVIGNISSGTYALKKHPCVAGKIHKRNRLYVLQLVGSTRPKYVNYISTYVDYRLIY